MTAAAVEVLPDLWGGRRPRQLRPFPDGPREALMKSCRGLFATTNLIYLSRQIPLLRERLIVLLCGGYDRVDMEGAASAARPEVTG